MLLLITKLVVLNYIFAIKVFYDITVIGIIVKETSPDKKYELLIRREKLPKFSKVSMVLTSVELYEEETGVLISNLEDGRYGSWDMFLILA